jgi:hypothetical protein
MIFAAIDIDTSRSSTPQGTALAQIRARNGKDARAQVGPEASLSWERLQVLPCQQQAWDEPTGLALTAACRKNLELGMSSTINCSMEDYRLMITDVTEYGDLRCVAGWDLDRKQMVRPEPQPASFWPSKETGPNRPFFPGKIVKFAASKPTPPTSYPHLNEDRVVQGTVALEQILAPEEFSAALREIQTPTTNTLFGAPVEFSNSKAYISKGTNHPSLQGLRVDRKTIRFFEDDFGGKRRPRCRLTTPNRTVNLSIAATDIRQLFRSEGIAAVARHFNNVDEVHIRMGLARGFGQFPNRCYMQVNGIYGL